MEELKVGEKGQVVIPAEITSKFGLKSGEKVFIKERYQYLILEKPKKMFGEKIVNLLKQGIENVTSEDIKKEREDREW